MKRTMFQMGLPGRESTWDGGRQAGIPVYKPGRDYTDRDSVLRKLPVPPGVSVEYPYMVKVEGDGEYWVHGDGTTQFYSYKYGRWEPPRQSGKNDTWYQMMHLDD